MNMTVNELLALLEDMADAGYGDREVLFAYQQHYPLQDHIAGGWVPGHNAYMDDDPVDESVVYLVSGGQCHEMPNGPSRAFEEVSESL